METAFGWIGQIAQFLGTLCPNFVHVETIVAAIIITRGRHVKELSPGIHIYWPFWSTVYTRPRVRQTDNLAAQALITKDNQSVVVSGMVRYEIDDAIKALAETHDVATAIIDESLAIVCEYVTQKTLSEIQEDRAGVNTDLTRKIRSTLRSYGINVLKAQLTDYCLCNTLNHVGNVQTGFGS